MYELEAASSVSVYIDELEAASSVSVYMDGDSVLSIVSRVLPTAGLRRNPQRRNYFRQCGNDLLWELVSLDSGRTAATGHFN